MLQMYHSMITLLHWFRSLSPASVAFIRALMDLCFIWSSCSRHTTGRNRSQVLLSLVRGGLVDPRNLPNFFYLHLERDVRDIAQLTGKNFEESTFLLHLVIRSLMDAAVQPCGKKSTRCLYNMRTTCVSENDTLHFCRVRIFRIRYFVL